MSGSSCDDIVTATLFVILPVNDKRRALPPIDYSMLSPMSVRKFSTNKFTVHGVTEEWIFQHAASATWRILRPDPKVQPARNLVAEGVPKTPESP